MTRTELQEIIDREFSNFIEFPGDLRKAVTVASCKLFAEHVVGVIQPRPAVQGDVAGLVEALAELCDEIDKHEIHAAISKTSISWVKLKARKDLADYRKGAKP